MDFKNIGFNTGQAIGDFLYCSALNFNGLFKININTGDTIFLGYFPKEDYSGTILFRESYHYKNNIIFIPQHATGIVIYNVDLGEFVRIELGETVICNAYLIESILWIFPALGTGKIWKLNMDTLELIKYDNLSGWTDIRVDRIVYYNNNFWAANIDTNIILKIESLTLQIEEIVIDCPKLRTLAEAENGLWIITKNNNEVFRWNPDIGKLTKKKVDIKDNQNKQLYQDIIDTKGKTFAIPMAETPIMYLDEEEQVFKKACEFPLDFHILVKGMEPFFISRVYTKKGWCILPSNVNYMIFIGDNDNEISYISLKFYDIEFEKDIKDKYWTDLKKRLIIENIDITLLEYIKLVNKEI